MKFIASLIISVMVSVTSYCQPGEIKWSEAQPFGSEVTDLSRVLRDGDDLYLSAGLFNMEDIRICKLDTNGNIEKKELLKSTSDNESIRFIGMVPYNGEMYGYYLPKKGPAVVYRDRIDKTSFAFTGEAVRIVEGTRHVTDMINPILEKYELMDEYFGGDTDIKFLDMPQTGCHVIIKRISFGRLENVEMKISVIRNDLKLLNQRDIVLNSNNVNTRLFDVVIHSLGGLYLILGDFNEKLPVVSVIHYPPGNGEVHKSILSGFEYLSTMKGIIYKGGLLLAGLNQENKNKFLCDQIVIRVDTATLKVQSRYTMGRWDYDDLIHLVSNGETCMVIHDMIIPGGFIATTSSGDSGTSSRHSFGFAICLFDAEGKVMWEDTVDNRVTASAGSLWYDALFPFVYKGQYYMIENTHPDTYELISEGKKLKKALLIKGFFATELISFHPDEKNAERNFIYRHEDKVVTIPIHTRYMGDGQFLMYGDKIGIADSVQFGILSMDKE